MAENADPSGAAPAAGGGKITRLIKLGALLSIALILLLLLAAFAAALTAPATWAPFIRVFRDIFLLILLLESILVIAALTILLLQVAAFFVMLKAEMKPILSHARKTARVSKATAQFLNSNTIEPVIQLKSFLAGLLAFLRELIRLRGLVNAPETEPAATAEAPEEREAGDEAETA